ncbi:MULTISPECIES: LLM class flavin-dependent oxidoreductase [Pseudomonas syringae group]|uniref:Putative nitrilotriacetate monooxygenase, component A n=1 Tax=Pseudomonas coronafaciens pv. striafaciens TaxID=235276 RepID=A0A3M4Y0Z7_9PSED|nr:MULTISPECIES: LLM class flavin-dependent oxidoreductase [Pseudomonas syringae group]AKF53651.1 xenobiotic compound monooxygenase A subunit [Pseudomonas syringae pv. syringae HS191]ELS40780.1 Putative nitrilotriacetate monooxygenase, subunit A [Pseudomonas syringae pv. syringae B64]MBI6751485.1 LLM class flavin-dependent oxidoreductase [Pseudomonas syringae]MBI6771341.1 LLM class flavin-dependent oxidoreductase [Pseudomonas syringae]MBI6778281.1 LLM class flavin-dependent oxidoreductase [Pse
MSTTARQMKLGAFLMATGHHVAAWRHPDVPADAGLDFKHYRHVARVAEAAKFDALFVADSVAAATGDIASRMARSDHFEPLTLLSALSAVTEHIGLIATATTTYNEPYHVARKFASLDHLSGGRAGWNLVTSDAAAEAQNFGRAEHVGHAERYSRAREFHQVVTGLWDSWADDAFTRDKASGEYYDPGRLHVLNHQGEHFSVKGPLNVARSPQGQPVVVQAGSSEVGRDLAAQTAEVVFTAQTSLASAQAFYADLKGRLSAYGRAVDSLKIMPGVFIVVAETEALAKAKFESFQELVEPQVGVALLGRMLGNFDLSGYPLDGPLPELPLTDSGQRSRQKLLTELADQENLTLAQLGRRIAGGRGHYSLIGTPEQIADELQRWFEQGAADGFNVLVPHLPGGLEDVARLLVPELQRRGLFRTEYEGTTLRENLGLQRPAYRF